MFSLLLSIDWFFFDQTFLGEKVSNYLWFAGITVATLLLRKPLAALLTRMSSGLAARYSYLQHKATIGEMLFKPFEYLLQTILFFVAVNQLDTLLDHFSMHHIISRKKAIDVTLGDVVD